MLEVLEPFKVRGCHSSSVTQNVREELHSLFEKDLFGPDGGGAVGSLNDQPGVEAIGVVLVDSLLEGCGDEEVAT